MCTAHVVPRSRLANIHELSRYVMISTVCIQGIAPGGAGRLSRPLQAATLRVLLMVSSLLDGALGRMLVMEVGSKAMLSKVKVVLQEEVGKKKLRLRAG